MKDPKSALIALLALLLIASASLTVKLAWPDYQYRVRAARSDTECVPGTLRGINSALHKAVVTGDPLEAARAVSRGAEPDALAEWCSSRHRFVYTPALHIAAERGDLTMMQTLLSLGACAEARQWPGGATALHVAAINGGSGEIPWLAARIDPDSRDLFGQTPLIDASLWGAPSTIKALLDAGADPMLRDCRDSSALDYAIAQNRPDAAAALLRDPRVLASVDLNALLADVESRKYTERLARVIRGWIEATEDQSISPDASPD